MFLEVETFRKKSEKDDLCFLTFSNLIFTVDLGGLSMFAALPAELKNTPELSHLMDRYKAEHQKRKLIERERNELVERLEEEKRSNVAKFHEIERLKLQNNQMVHEMKRVGGKLGGYFDQNDQLVKTREELMLENVRKSSNF